MKGARFVVSPPGFRSLIVSSRFTITNPTFIVALATNWVGFSSRETGQPGVERRPGPSFYAVLLNIRLECSVCGLARRLPHGLRGNTQLLVHREPIPHREH